MTTRLRQLREAFREATDLAGLSDDHRIYVGEDQEQTMLSPEIQAISRDVVRDLFD